MITSVSNAKIKNVMQLNQKAKARREQGLFVAEGRKMFLEAPESWVSQVFVSETVSQDGELMSQAEKYPCEIVKDSVFRQMCDTKTPQGILTVLKLPSWSEEEVLAGKNPLVMVLEDLQDPGNAGMIIRTADALGLDGVIFTESCDIYNPKVVRSTMGSIFRIPVYRDIPADDVFAAMDSAVINTYAAVVDRDAVDIKTVDFRNGGGIVIGNEGNGLPEEIILKCTQRITIKMNGNIDSLNAAMATGIIMWELMKFE